MVKEGAEIFAHQKHIGFSFRPHIAQLNVKM